MVYRRPFTPYSLFRSNVEEHLYLRQVNSRKLMSSKRLNSEDFDTRRICHGDRKRRIYLSRYDYSCANGYKSEHKKVLVIGAGDGGTVRELTSYPSIKQIDMVEIDELVVDVCREYLPQTASKLDDLRVNLYFEDGPRNSSATKKTTMILLSSILRIHLGRVKVYLRKSSMAIAIRH